jgi:hypothetical protein
MRMLRGVALAGVLALGGGACAPMMSGFGFAVQPACPVYQARAYRTTSIMATRQRVQQIQARYSLSYKANARAVDAHNLVSGECR